MNTKHVWQYATAVTLALAMSTAYAAGDAKSTSTDASTTTPMTGKEKATAIGATSGAVAGAVVGGPVGAVVGAGIGAYVGNQGTDANGKVASSRASDSTVRNAQAALNDKGFDVGKVDGQFGPSTQSAVRRFQSDRGLAQSGRLDSATLAALGVTG